MKNKYKILSYVLLFMMLFAYSPVQAEAALSKSVTITTQSQLDNALNNSNISKITVKPVKDTNFIIPSGDYHKDLVVYQTKVDITNNGSFNNLNVIVVNEKELSKALKTYNVDTITLKTTTKSNVVLNGENSNIDLIVDASKMGITNNSQWKSILVKNNASWIENAQGNKFTVTASKFNLTTSENAAIASIYSNKSSATLNINANSTIESVKTKSNATINLSGSFEGQVLNSISKENAKSKVKVNSNSATYSIESYDSVVQVKSSVSKTHTHDAGAWIEQTATTTRIGAKVRYCTECRVVLEIITTPMLTAEPTPTPTPTHTHNYVVTSDIAATCIKIGVKTYTCTEDGKQYVETTPATGHNQGTWVEKIAPTYNSTGTKVRVCTKCDAVLETSTIPKLTQVHTHSYTSKITIAATCTKDGIITFTCKDGDHTYTEVIPKTGHDEGKWYEQKATTTVNGVKVRACTKCGAILESAVIPKLTEEVHAHNYTSKITTTATCKTEGIMTYTCKNGDHTYTKSIAKLAHTPGAWEVVTEATITTTGLKVQKCTVCGETLTTETIPVVAHTHNYVGVVTTPATETSKGVMTYTCVDGDHTYTEEIPMLEVEDKETVNGHELVTVTIDIGNGQTKEVKGYYDYAMAQEVYQKLNDLRISKGLNTLNWSNSMAYAADVRAAELTAKFDHWRPNGEYCYYIHDDMSSENVAMGYTLASDVMVGWINSLSHYNAMIKSDYKSVSISCFMYEAIPGQYIGYWSMLFSKK